MNCNSLLHGAADGPTRLSGVRRARAAPCLAAVLAAGALLPAQQKPAAPTAAPAPAAKAAEPPTAAASLDEMRLAMGKWIETQQIVAKERKEWQQGKEILVNRLELVKKEIATLEEKIQQAQAKVAEADKKRQQLVGENDQLKATNGQLASAVVTMETDLRRMMPTLPDPVKARVQPLSERMPTDAATTKVSVAERFQNVLGILGEVNKANSEISVLYEVRTLGDGRRSEVQAIYVGLGQAYYVSADGEAGVGRPGPDGWKWESTKALHRDLETALDILQGKHSPAFVPLPVILQ